MLVEQVVDSVSVSGVRGFWLKDCWKVLVEGMLESV